MSLHVARRCVEVLGPCRILHAGASDTALVAELLHAGCDAWAAADLPLDHPRWLPSRPDDASPVERFDAFVIELGQANDIARMLGAHLAHFGTPGALVLRAKGHSRRGCDAVLLESGWRRHPGDMRAADYEGLSDDTLGELSFYQRIPEAAARRWSVADLRPERGLHMDMLRESGCRADAHIVRYALAAAQVRPGDTVLDCACGLGYGTAVLASLSAGSRYIGVDADAGAVAYAQANYGGADVSYRVGDAAVLEGIADASVDLVVSMETLEHVADWHAAARAFRRVLKPDGRLIASVPDRWVDHTGTDPNPHHLHVFDWAKLHAGLRDDFIIEARYVQAAPGGFKLPGSRRVLRQVELEAVCDAEWALVVASANPFAVDEDLRAAFKHPAFDAALAASGAAVVDFGRYYDNPYLYRVMVQMGERLRDEAKLGKLAYWVLTHARAGSADQGAAMCVLGYRALEQRDTAAAGELLRHVDRYMAATAEERGNPHVIRWRLSLAFLAGKLAEISGDLAEALRWYDAAAHGNWRDFSPLLATKTISAAFCGARLHLARRDEAAAKACFAHGLAEALAAIGSNARDIVGDAAQPIPFGLTELAEIADMGSQCANAIARLPLWRRDAGVFWRQVDVKRFGLATWLRDLERDNAMLRHRLTAMTAVPFTQSPPLHASLPAAAS